jgi:hypothetical protein
MEITKTKEELEEELKRLNKYYHEELARRDRLIDELKESHTALLKASLKSSDKINLLSEALRKLLKKQKKL